MNKPKSRKEKFVISPISSTTGILNFSYKLNDRAETAFLGDGNITKYEVVQPGKPTTINPLVLTFQGNIQQHIMTFDMGVVEWYADLIKNNQVEKSMSESKKETTEAEMIWNAWNVFVKHPLLNVIGYELEQGVKHGIPGFQAVNKTKMDQNASHKLVKYHAAVNRALQMTRDQMMQLAFLRSIDGFPLDSLRSMTADQIFIHLFGMENNGYYYNNPDQFLEDVQNEEFNQLALAGQAIALGIIKMDENRYFKIGTKVVGRFQTDIVAYWREDTEHYVSTQKLVAERAGEFAHNIGDDWTAKQVALEHINYIKEKDALVDPESEKKAILLEKRKIHLVEKYGYEEKEVSDMASIVALVEKVAMENAQLKKALSSKK